MFKCKYCGYVSNTKRGIAIHEKYCNSNKDRTFLITDGTTKKNVTKSEYDYYKSNGWYLYSNLRDRENPISTLGFKWINNGKDCKFVRGSDVQRYTKNGWSLGYTEDKKKTFCGSPGIAKTEEGEKERRLKISKAMKGNPKAGGYREGSGRGKRGWYKGIFCDSSWELAFLVYHLDKHLNISRAQTNSRKYYYNNQLHRYTPDFITDEGIIEIKGYKTAESVAKHMQNPDIKILYKNDMALYIDYAKATYGKDWIKYLYSIGK